jgi:hypothetical protein
LFWVEAERVGRFKEVFGPDGSWELWLAQDKGYLGLDLWCESEVEGRYRLRDFWSSHWYFESFRRRSAAELDEFNRMLKAEKLIWREWIAGTYYESDDSDEAGLVSA